MKVTHRIRRHPRKEAAASTGAPEARLAAIVESSYDAIIGETLEGVITSWNKGAERLFGWTEPEAVGRRISIIAPPGREQEQERNISRINRGEHVDHFETVRRRKDGGLVEVSISLSPILDASGAPAGVSAIIQDITERKRSEEQRARLAAIVESSADAIYGYTLDGTITDWNAGAERLFGYTRAQIIGRPLSTIMPEDLPGEVSSLLARLGQGMRVEAYETRRRRKDGGVVAVSVTTSPLRNASGRIVGAAVIARDVTERRRLEEGLRRRAEEVKDLYDNAPCGYHSLDENGVFVHMNDTELRWLGYAREEVLGKMSFVDVVTPKSLEVFRENFPGFKERGWVRDLELELVRRDGSTFPILVSATAVTDGLGRYVMSRSTLYDVTDLRRAQKSLEEARAFLNSVVENIPAMVVVKEASDLRLILLNKAGEEILGVPRAQIVGKTDHDLFPKDEADFFIAKDREALTDGVVDIPDEPIQTKAGLRFLHTRKIPIRGADGRPTHLLLIAEDITERKRLQQTKDEVIAMTSHELQNPLTTLSLCLSMLAAGDGGALDAKGETMVKMGLRTVGRMSRMIGDFLDIEKLESGRLELVLEPVEIEPLVHEALRSLEPLAVQYGISFARSGTAAGAKVIGDADRLMQVVINLLSNAAKFTKAGSEVTLSVQRSEGRIRVSVADLGPGIPEEFQTLIFQRFAQARIPGAREKGTGLGLSICKAIVDKLGGTIGFSTKNGEGTTFHFELPEAPPPTP